MAITRDTISAGVATTGTSIAWAHTVSASLSGSGIFVGVGYALAASITSVSWDTAGVNEALSKTVHGVTATVAPTANAHADLWWRASPTAGTSKTITVTPVGSCELNAGAESVAGWSGLFNAHSPASASVGANTNPSVTISTAPDEWVIDAMVTDNNGAQGAMTETGAKIFATSVGAGNSNGGGQDKASVGASVTMNWTGATSTLGAGNVAVALIPTTPGIHCVTTGGATVATSASTWSIVTGGSSMAAGSAVVLGLGVASSVVTISTITDNTTNVYLLAVRRLTPLPACGAELWYCQGYSTASTRISVTLSATSSGGLGYANFVGFSTLTPLGGTASSGNSTNSSVHSMTELTSTSNGALVISFSRVDVSTITPIRQTSSYATWLTTNAVGAVREFGQYQVQPTASTATSLWTHGGAATSSGVCLFSGVHAIFYDTVVVGGGGGFAPPAFTFCLTGVQSPLRARQGRRRWWWGR